MTIQSTARNAVRKQIRAFVGIWIGITLLMGTCTFLAIYMAYGALNQDARGSTIRLPQTATSQSVAASNVTAVPTRQLTQPPTLTPTQTQAASTQTDLPTQGPTATPLPASDVRFDVGIQVQVSPDRNPENQAGWMGLVSDQLHMSWIKQQVRWEDFEREEDQYDWSELDFSLPIAAERHVKVMLSIVTAPDWAREPGIDTSRHGPPADPQDYAEFVTEIVERFPGMVHGIEVWNEMNLDREWTSARGLSAANYVELLRTTYEAVKAIDPGIIIISGALSPTGLSDGIRAWDDFTYMDQLIAAGMLNYVDCVGAHHNGINVGPSFTWDAVPNDPNARFRGPFDNPHHSWSFRSTLQTYANKIQVAGGDQRLCVTEFGWASVEDMSGFPAGFEFARDNSLEEQKDYIVQAVSLMEEWDTVWLAFLWNLNYGPQAGWATDNDNVPYSLIGPDFNFRPAYDAIGEWMQEYREREGE
jgi:polysaccharide biosynthesis protein PslG